MSAQQSECGQMIKVFSFFVLLHVRPQVAISVQYCCFIRVTIQVTSVFILVHFVKTIHRSSFQLCVDPDKSNLQLQGVA